MSLVNDFTVDSYDFNVGVIDNLKTHPYARSLWPLVYILSDGIKKEAYIGETADTYARMASHLKHNGKNKLSVVHLIASDRFNKSATLDIESNLIKYISGDGTFKLLNVNVGLANHNFHDKPYYQDIFKSLWEILREQGISKNSLEFIDNSNLFKYSPYKTLGPDQKQGLLVVIKNLLSDTFNTIIVEGGAGTGKTILAIFLFKLLRTNIEDFNYKEFGDDEAEFIELVYALKKKYPGPKMALVIPMSSFRETIKKVFKHIKGLSEDMVIGPSSLASKNYDIVLVDESHRLRRRVNLGSYYGTFDKVSNKLGFDKMTSSELDWVIQQSQKAILFYDENQSIKPSDTRVEDFEKLKALTNTNVEHLSSQFRVRGGKEYVQYLNKLFEGRLISGDPKYRSREYEFLLFDSFEDMVREIRSKNNEYGLSRFIAGYSWKWASNKDKKAYDIKIESLDFRWNSVSKDWVNSPNAINEFGCIHTTQGYDLNYAGIIFGNEITYNVEKEQIEILKENYYDANGKNSISDPEQLRNFIVNIYKTIMLRGIRGTYLYVCDDALRHYLSLHLVRYKQHM